MAVQTFREYLLSRRVKLPRVSIPHLSWDDKRIGAIIGMGTLITLGIGFSIGFLINFGSKLFLLLLIGCPFLWFYIDYCEEREDEKEKR